jgi:SAM-dependent methyltransferase
LSGFSQDLEVRFSVEELTVEILGSFRDQLLRWLRPAHRKLRGQKVDMFLRLVGDTSGGSTLLDVGAGTGIDGEFLGLYSSFSQVVAVNLDTRHFQIPTSICVKTVEADGRNLPFKSKSFDWVFSNAVIEHVGGLARQKEFANEIRRVATKGYFVATPDKHFPIEPHTLLPFYQFLTPKLQRRIVRLSPGYMRQPLEINLLSRVDLCRLFPEARILKIGLPVFPNSLAAMYRADKDWTAEPYQWQTARGATGLLDEEARC